MGKCMNCGYDMKIKDDESRCPSCGQRPYVCWNCHETIKIEDTNECNVCGFYICNFCGHCGPNCDKESIIKELIEKYKLSSKDAREIIERLMKKVKGKIKKKCPEGVPYTYAKDRLRRFVLKMDGVGVTSDEDQEAFKSRFDEILEIEEGQIITVSKAKKHGEHGQEERDVLNLAICMGFVEKQTQTNEDGKNFEIWTKNEHEPCEHINTNELQKKRCPKCNKTFSMDKEKCDICKYKKGKNKGDFVKLVRQKSIIHFCQLKYDKFIELKEDEEIGCD